MILALVYGLVTGIALCFTFGTVFFSLVQNSVDNGYRTGMKIAFGVVVCDSIFVFCAIFGTAFLPKIDQFEDWVAGIGILFLFILGGMNLFKGQPQIAYPGTRLGNFMYYFTTGFLLNGLNPVNFITWVTIAGYLKGNWGYKLNELIIFFCGSVLMIFITQSLIAVFAHKLKRLFTPRTVTIFNRVTGAVFIFIAFRILYTQFLAS